MRRDAGRHADCDSLCTIHQNVRDLDRKNRRFFLCLIKVRHKINNILIKVSKKNFLCQFLQTCFCVTHRRSAVALDGAEVSMSIYQRPALLEVLRHNDQRIIDRAVAVRMIFTHCISDDTGTFTVRAVITDPEFIHII